MAVHQSVIDLIGNTPLVDVSRLSPDPDVRILAKLESQNPAGSVKDRIAQQIILEAEADGSLRPGQQLIESVVGQHRHRPGHDRPAQGLPDQDRAARERLDRAPPAARDLRRRDHPVAGRRGLERRRAPGAGDGRRAPRLVLPVPVRQRGQPPGPLRDHRPRDLARLPRDHALRRRPGHVGHVDGRRHVPQGAEPDDQGLRRRAAQRRAGRGPAQPRRRLHPARSTRSGAAPTCSTASASSAPASPSSGPAAWSPSAAIFAGISSGAALAGAVKVAERLADAGESGTIVFIVCDGGWKYLSTGAWTDDLDEVVERAEKIIYF